MADPAPALEQTRADPANAQYVINLTPEQYESYIKRAEVKDVPPPPRTQIEMGGSGTAKVSFTDAVGGAVEITSVEWSATGPVAVTPDEADPTSAEIVPLGLGPANITATANGGSQAHIDVLVVEKVGAPVAGTIEITAQPGAEGSGEVPAHWPAGQAQGSQIMPVPPIAPPRPGTSRVPPAQTMAQPSPQPQPQDTTQPAQP